MNPKSKNQGKSTKYFGYLGENFAISLLERNGYKVIDRNFRCFVGEIDLVAIDETETPSTLVFVEVKTRKSRQFGEPEEAVGSIRLSRLKKAGEYYLNLHPKLPKKQRIDVVSIMVKGNKIDAKIIKVF